MLISATSICSSILYFVSLPLKSGSAISTTGLYVLSLFFSSKIKFGLLRLTFSSITIVFLAVVVASSVVIDFVAPTVVVGTLGGASAVATPTGTSS